MPQPVNFSEPNNARVYDFLIGGKDNFWPDRKLAADLEDPVTGHPGVRQLALENRAFILKAVRWVAAMKGIRQFIDAGCGFTASPSVHQVASEGGLAAVAYVDRDPLVLSHVRADLRDAGPGVAVTAGDVSDPATVLADEGLRNVIDLSEPACVVLGATLSSMDAGTAQKAVAGFAEALAPGSAVIISCAHFAGGLGERMAGMICASGPWHNHDLEDVGSFFAAADLRLVRGEAGDVRCWPLLSACEREACMLGGIGIKGQP